MLLGKKGKINQSLLKGRNKYVPDKRNLVLDVCPLVSLRICVFVNVCVHESTYVWLFSIRCCDIPGRWVGIPTEAFPERSFTHIKRGVPHWQGSCLYNKWRNLSSLMFTVSTQPGSLFHTGGIPVAEQRVKKQAVPGILIWSASDLISPFSVLKVGIPP